MLYIIILLKYLDKKYHESCSLSEISSIKRPYLILILNSLEHIYYFLLINGLIIHVLNLYYHLFFYYYTLINLLDHVYKLLYCKVYLIFLSLLLLIILIFFEMSYFFLLQLFLSLYLYL
jgi:hypothetical protein